VASTPWTDVFFDFGGTLFSYAALGGQGFDLVASASSRLGIDAPAAELGSAFARASRASWAAFAGRPYYLHRDLFHDAFRRWAREFGAEPDQAFLDWMHESQRDSLLERFTLREGCLSTLRELRGRGLRLSIVSNIDDDYLHPMLARAGLDALLHHWSSSEEARSCKPDAAFFHYACRKAGCRPEQVLFVGDSPEHDIAGARALGMTTVLIPEVGAEPPGKGTSRAGQPHHVIRSLPQLLDLVDGPR
jgi:2-haloalkanoic acid dehalogenase type II